MQVHEQGSGTSAKGSVFPRSSLIRLFKPLDPGNSPVSLPQSRRPSSRLNNSRDASPNGQRGPLLKQVFEFAQGLNRLGKLLPLQRIQVLVHCLGRVLVKRVRERREHLGYLNRKYELLPPARNFSDKLVLCPSLFRSVSCVSRPGSRTGANPALTDNRILRIINPECPIIPIIQKDKMRKVFFMRLL